MSMHLVHPSLSATGKKKGKKQFKSAEHAKQSRELSAQREKTLKEFNIDLSEKKKDRGLAAKPYQPATPVRRETQHVKSAAFTGAPCLKIAPKEYSGDLVIGIAQMSKSNAVPVISQDEILEIAKMRR